MAQKCSQAIELLPSPTIEWMTGSSKNCTARICKNGRNVLMPKVKQPNKTGADPGMFQGAGKKWRSMSKEQKKPWQNIAEENHYRSAWNAFISSFIRSVAIYGLDHSMNHELGYIDSTHRQKKAQQLQNSIKRLHNYKVEEEFYKETESILAEYPVQFTNEHVYFRLQDQDDVNKALAMGWLYRTDDFYEYQFDPTESDELTEKGSYTLKKRPRQEQELFQPIH